MSSGFTPDGLSKLRDVAEHGVASGQAPGLVVLVARGSEVHTEALGTLTEGADRPVQRDSLFRIASMTKPVTGAATLALATEGLLRLDEPVARLLPELASRRVLRRMDGPLDDTVPAAREITVRDLLTFTFGFGLVAEMFTAAEPWPVVRAEGELHLATIGPPSLSQQPPPDEWIAGLGSLPLFDQPGERWMYNTGASVLGELLARSAGQPFADVLRTRIFEPLGMRDTAFWTPETDRLATAYQGTPDGGREAWDEPDGYWSSPPAFPDGAAGLVSTAGDMLAFGRMLAGDGAPVLPASAARAMRTDQLTPEQKAHGWLTGPFDGESWSYCQSVRADGAFGWAGGFGTTWLVDPARDLVMIVLTQQMFESPVLPPVHQGVQDAAVAALA